MRIVVTLAALLALHSGVLAGGLYAGDEAPGAAADSIVPAATAQGECDTSVYHLEHARAGQLIGRVKNLIAQISAYSADEDVAALPKSVVLLPTSSDDTIIAICPRAHAALVKHAIKSCDALKQYAVKVQLFEVADSGKTIPVGGPHLLIGREGAVQCTTPEESVSVNFKVDTPIADANTEVPADLSDAESADVSGAQAGAHDVASGRCRLDCPPPIREMSVESECDPSGIVHFSASLASDAESCSQSATCPACKTGSCTADCCKSGCCHGQSSASSCQTSGCKCDGSCCSVGESAPKSQDTTNYGEALIESPAPCSGEGFSVGIGFGAGGPGLHFVGPLVWFNKGDEPRCAACEYTAGECPAGECHAGECPACEHKSDTANHEAPGGDLHISFSSADGPVQSCPSVVLPSSCWPMPESIPGTVFKCFGIVPCEAAQCSQSGSCPGQHESEVADSDDGHDADAINMVPPAPADAPAPERQISVGPGGNLILNHLPAPVAGDPNTFFVTLPAVTVPAPSQCSHSGKIIFRIQGDGLNASRTIEYGDAAPSEPCDCDKIAKSIGKLSGAKVFSFDGSGNCVVQVQVTGSGSSCTDGCPALTAGQNEASASHAAPCSCEEAEDAQAPGAEPPALLTLSQHKEPSSALAPPHWQEELLKAFRGRRLSELFEPQAGQTPAGHELGRLLAEFPKHDGAASTGHSGAHSLTIVDLPDRVRIFESTASVAQTEKSSDAVRPAIVSACPSCREEFRVFLEEMFRAPEASQDIAQTSHHEGDAKATEAARDLPNVTHSKIACVTVSYPLRDLVLCDDAGHPVFDTCSIIDHLESAVAPETWSHPSVSIRLDQQSVSLVITQTAEVHQKITDHLRYLRRLQIKQICSLIEHLSGDTDEAADPSAQNDTSIPNADVELGTGLPVGR
jgi:hypothetical protein